jgi:hypothetical protein
MPRQASPGEMLAIDLIRGDGATQPRARIDPALVEDYAADMRRGDEFPPVVVFFDGTDRWLADGFHHRDAGHDDIAADIRQGTRRDAILHSVGANARHGWRRTNEDKRRAVLTLLGDAEWSLWSNREIARRCGVDDHTVATLRPKTSAEFPPTPEVRKFERGGKVHEMDVAGINAGRVTPPRPDPGGEAPAWDAGQLERKALAEAGKPVRLDMHREHALRGWAEETGRFVRCDRRSDFGNPYVVGEDGDRDECCDGFEHGYWPHKRSLHARVPELAGGKVLGCWCAQDERCHCETLIKALAAFEAGGDPSLRGTKAASRGPLAARVPGKGGPGREGSPTRPKPDRAF